MVRLFRSDETKMTFVPSKIVFALYVDSMTEARWPSSFPSLFSIYASSTHPHRREHNSNVFYTVSHHVSLYYWPASLRHTNTQRGDDTGTQLSSMYSSSHNSNLNWSRQRQCLLLHCQRFQWILNGHQTASRGRTWPCIIHQTQDSSFV